MIHSENIEASNLDQQQIEQFLNDGSTSVEFLSASGISDLHQQVFLDNDIPGSIEDELQSADVPTDLHYIDSSDLIPVDPHLAQPTLSELLNKGNNVTLPENIPIANMAPKLEEHNNAGMDFELNLNPSNNSKNWYYSSALRKVFIKLDKAFYIEAIYTPKTEEQLYLRVMMVYVNNPFSPVQRCQNHLFRDQSVDINIKHNVLRSENSSVTYLGTPGGKNVNDRLSLLIPLGFEKPDEYNQVRNSIALKFVCQNSCIGREPTAVIFTLENFSSEVLGKRVVHVKVCSCPKRDRSNDEKKFLTIKKRESEDMDYHPDKKLAKMMKIKEEPDSSSITSPLTAPSSPDEVRIEKVRVVIDLPSISLARDVVRGAFNTVAGHMALNARHSEKYSNCLKDLKKMLDEYNTVSSEKKCE